ncbi:MAG: hypothetical protein QOF51_2397, partial [Chloroflexota bacterium]|nr:hypothetical protein [Chloroflexota bacterium]
TSHEPRATSHEPRATSHEPRATSHEPRATSHSEAISQSGDVVHNASADRPGLPPASMDRFLHLVGRAETPLDIGRPATEIYAYLMDVARHAEWEQTIQAVEPASATIEPTSDAAVGPASGATAGPVIGAAVVPASRVAFGPGARFPARASYALRWDKLPLTTQPSDDASVIELVAAEAPLHIVWRTTATEARWSSETELVLERIAEAITTVRMRRRLLAPREQLETLVYELQERGYPLDVVQRQVDRSMHNLRTILEGRAKPTA